MTNTAWENSVFAYDNPSQQHAECGIVGLQNTVTSEERHWQNSRNTPTTWSTVLISLLIESSACLLLEFQRDILCKSNVFVYICALDAISAQSYSVFSMVVYKKDKSSD